MAQRFNAPPGWNVPPDFVPPSDWQPDPSWPPAPEGWNYWVDDAAQPAANFGSSSTPSYGAPPPSPAYGAEQTPYGSAPPGAFGSTAPGTAQAAVAQTQAKGARNSIIIGAGLLLLVIVLLFAIERLFWYLGILGIVLVIKGLIDMNKAKKAEAAALGYGQGTVPPGFTPPGTTPPGQNPPGF